MLMEVLQMLKFSLKKDWQSISFTNGWKTAEAEMIVAQNTTKEDLLAKLLIRDCQATTDALLKIIDNDIDKQVELDGDN